MQNSIRILIAIGNLPNSDDAVAAFESLPEK
jgi:hypothetical protein